MLNEREYMKRPKEVQCEALNKRLRFRIQNAFDRTGQSKATDLWPFILTATIISITAILAGKFIFTLLHSPN